MATYFFRVTIVAVSELVLCLIAIITVIFHRIWMHIWLMADILWCTVCTEIGRFKLIISYSIYDHSRCIIR